jgi:hypothetical protein
MFELSPSPVPAASSCRRRAPLGWSSGLCFGRYRSCVKQASAGSLAGVTAGAAGPFSPTAATEGDIWSFQRSPDHPHIDADYALIAHQIPESLAARRSAIPARLPGIDRHCGRDGQLGVSSRAWLSVALATIWPLLLIAVAFWI